MIYKNEFQDFNITPAQINLLSNTRAFYRDLAIWMRAYLESVYTGLGNLDAVKKRLEYIPAQYSYMFRLFFGDTITEEYVDFLVDFIKTYEALVMAQINGDVNAVYEHTKHLYEYADKSAAYLAQINPFWQEMKWKYFLYDFIRLSIEESTTFLTKDYKRNVEIFDRLMDHINQIGDYLSEGLIKYINYPVTSQLYSINEFQNFNITPEQMNLIFRARAFYRDLVVWTRSYLVSLYAGLGNLQALRQKIDEIPLKYSDLFRLFFGEKITEQYTSFFTDFIQTYEALVNAQITGDTNAVGTLTRDLYKIADNTSAFFSQINPFWQENEWKELLYTLIRLMIDESTTFLTKDYVRNVEIFDRLIKHTYQIGDYLSRGLLNYLTYSGRPQTTAKY